MMKLFSRAKPSRPVSSAAEVDAHVRTFVAQHSNIVQAADLERSLPLFSSGILDSLGFVQLVSSLEERFGVDLGAGATMETLDTIEAISATVLAAKST